MTYIYIIQDSDTAKQNLNSLHHFQDQMKYLIIHTNDKIELKYCFCDNYKFFQQNYIYKTLQFDWSKNMTKVIKVYTL